MFLGHTCFAIHLGITITLPNAANLTQKLSLVIIHVTRHIAILKVCPNEMILARNKFPNVLKYLKYRS